MAENNLRGGTTVVVEEKKSRRGLAFVAAGAAACLLLGGGTYALWSDSAAFTGGTITAGNLDLIQNADTAFYDVSLIDGADNAALATDGVRLDETEGITGTTGVGHAITPADWRIVPGDTVAAVYDATIVLKGDNLVADLTVAGLADGTAATSADSYNTDGTATDNKPTDDSGDTETEGAVAQDADGFDGTNLSYSYTLYQNDTALAAPAAVPADGTLATFSALAAGQADGADDGVAPVIQLDAEEANITVVITAYFDVDTAHRVDVTAAELLDGVDLSLVQTRSAGAQYVPAATTEPEEPVVP